MENDKSLLDGDFINQVMTQFDGIPADMMEYVEEYVVDRAKEKADDMIAIETIPLAPTSPPRQLTNGPTTIENEVIAMDTRERDAKRRRDPVMTRQKSKTILDTED